MKVLTGSLELAAGNVRLGETARIGYYEQVGAVTVTDVLIGTMMVIVVVVMILMMMVIVILMILVLG